MIRELTKHDVLAAVKGGSIYACGGGGWEWHGIELGNISTTIGRPILVTIDELDDNDIIATSAAIGAPGDMTNWEIMGIDYVRSVQLLEKELGEKVKGLMIG